MGQYHLTVNIDKKEFIHPHQLGDGLKLWEQLHGPFGIASALVILLAVSNGRGGGDLEEDAEIVGRWGGDRIAIVGDYAEDTDLKDAPAPASEIYGLCRTAEDRSDPADGREFTDITPLVVAYIERLARGKYIGDGWRKFVQEDELVWKWAGGNERRRIGGKVTKITDKKVTVAWSEGGTKTYNVAKPSEWFTTGAI